MHLLQRQRQPGLILVALASLIAAGRADAHALGAECKLNGGRVELEAYYDDDTPARDTRVRVEDANKQVVAEGRTDAKGCWSFPRPRPGKYVVIVDAGAGHRTQLKLTIPEGSASASSASASTADAVDCPCCADPSHPAGTTQEEVFSSMSEGPSRGEFTRFPWVNLAIGVVLLGSVALAFLIARRVGKPAP